MNTISLLINYKDDTILQAFETIEIESTYSTIDPFGNIGYVFINEINGDYIKYDIISPFTDEGHGVCLNCAEEFEVRYDDRAELIGIEPIATCPHCEAKYSNTYFIDPSEIKGVENE